MATRGRWAELAAALLAGLLGGCDAQQRGPESLQTGRGAASSPLLEAADDEAVPVDASPQRHASAKRAGERVAIAAGRFLAGSMPGDLGRDPVLEPALLEVKLEAFEIDRLSYPNDPAQAPRTGVSREQAQGLCAKRGGRLCSELEWERACQGPDGQAYAGGDRWAPACGSAPQTCASGFGVLAMGAAMREWTASDVLPIKELQSGAAAVRGAAAAAADVDHRCAHRTAVAPSAVADDLGFRCCYGTASSPAIASPQWLPAYTRVDFPPSLLETMVPSIPALASLSGEIKYFREENAIATVKQGGDAGRKIAGLRGEANDPPPVQEPLPEEHELTTAPLLWNPLPGAEIVVVTGRSEANSFILAFHRFSDGKGAYRYRVASSLIMLDEPGPVVLVYQPQARSRLYWTTCWDCHGETGNIRYRNDHRIVITQK